MMMNKPLLTALVACTALAMTGPLAAAEFEFGGTLEVESTDTRHRLAGVTNNDHDTYVATFELTAGVIFNEHWRIDGVLLAEDIDNTDPDEFRPRLHEADDRPDRLHLEELVLTYTRGSTEAAIGRYTVPFGSFETAVISDPQTLENGETKTSLGATVRHSWGNLGAQVSWFNGNLRSTAPDESGYSVGIDWAASEQLRLGAGYLSSQGAAADAPSLWNLYAAGEQGDWHWHAELVTAAHQQNGEKPRAWSLDAGYDINDRWSVGARYQWTDRAGVLDGGDGDYREWALAGFYSPWEHVTLGLEYARGDEGPADARHWLMQAVLEF